MPIPPSSLSQVCRNVAQFVRAGINASDSAVTVLIGNPAMAVPDGGGHGAGHRLNLFFYRFDTGGFQSDLQPADPWRLRMHCLFTPFAVAETDGATTTSAGENNLRLLGDVMRLFHEVPILPQWTISAPEQDPTSPTGNVDTVNVRVQAVMTALSLEDLHNIWGTQGEVTYRPSVAYEMSLIPVMPRGLRPPERLAGALGADVRADITFAGGADTAARPLEVTRQVVDTAAPDWAPRICLIHARGCHVSLAFREGSPELAAFSPSVWVAGDPAASVTLQWEAWGLNGWAPLGPPRPATPQGPVLDPQAVDDVTGVAYDLPRRTTGQYLLYARRRVSHPAGDRDVRSNPVLVTIHA